MSRQPDRDWRSELARHDVRASHENVKTQVSIFRFILRVIFLPVWLPFYLYGVAKRRRVTREFVLERAKNRLIDASLIDEIALAWAEAHPDDYPLGEYDPGLGKLRRQFKRIIESDRR